MIRSKNRKKLLVVVCLLLLLGGYAWYFQQTIHRVQRSVEAENNTKQQGFFKNDLTYGDLSRTVKETISEQDFDAWTTWKDVDKTFAALQRPEANQSDYVYQVPLVIGTAYVYYDFELTGLKLRYVDVIP
ncbi:MAG: hypothetical protein WCC10_09375 [Tumebacillaceae bacterium]